MTKRDATPANGTQVDPSVAITSTGRLVAATDIVTSTPDRVHIWNRVGGGDVPTGTLVPGSPAREPSLAWNGGPTANLATSSSPGCGTPGSISTWSYTVSNGNISSTPKVLDAAPVGASVAQTWPRTVLGAPTAPGLPASVLTGRPIVVADQEDCTTGDHAIVVGWDAPSHAIDDLTRAVPESPVVLHDSPRYPDAAVLGESNSGATSIIIAYLGELSGGQQDVRVRQCLVGDLSLDCSSAPVTIDRITPAGTLSKSGTTVDAIAAPAIACGSGACTVVWTEAAGGGRSRVFRSRAVADDPADPTSGYTQWPSGTQVAASTTAGSQLLPSVAVTGSRADVVYLNLADDGTVDSLQTTFDGMARGDDISLVDGPAFDPGSRSLGERTDAAEITGGPAAILAGYFPDDNGGQGTVSEAELAHGTTPPVLAAPGAGKTLPKNTSFSLAAWLGFDDPDGDPATVTVDNPAHGSVTNGVYTAPTYVGADTVTVRATYGATVVTSAHTITIPNQAPVLDAPAPAIVDEGGAIVTVPLHADDPDLNDAIVYSIASAEAPLNVAGRATIVGATLRLDIPAGVRATSPLRITVRARDTTTPSSAALDDYQDLSVTIRPDLATPTTAPPVINVTGSRATLSARVTWIDASNACLKAAPRTCHVRQVWNFGDGTPSLTTTDTDTLSIDHPYAKAGRYSGQVTTWVLWGGSQVAAAPQPFTVTIADDGRVVAAVTPKVKATTSTTRQVTVVITARASCTAVVTITYATKKGMRSVAKLVSLQAGKTTPVTFSRISLKALKSRRATIKISNFGMLAGGTPPKAFTRLIILR